jgi:hypothetical protein
LARSAIWRTQASFISSVILVAPQSSDLGADLGFRVGQRQDDRLVGHRLDHLGVDHAGGRAAHEDIAADHGVSQGALVGVAAEALLGGVELAGQGIGALAVDHALGVADQDVLDLDAEADHDVEAGNRGRAGARDGHLDLTDVLADQFQAVEQGGARDDRGAMLVVVEDRNVHALLELLLDVEAFGRLDVFQVDAAQGGLHRGDDVDQLVGIVLGQFDVEHVDAGEFLEQAALAFHHRLGGQRADIAQAQHGGAVGDHGDQVAAAGVFGGQARVLLDRQARVGNPGRVSQRQIALVRQRLGRVDGDLALAGRTVIVQCGVAQRLFCGGHIF